MEKLLFSLDIKTAKKLSALEKQQKIRRIYHGIYTENLNDPLEKIVYRHWMKIIPFIVSKGILSFRTAVDLKPTPYQKESNIIFITSTYTKTITLPGLIIKVYKGIPDVYCDQVLPNLARSNIPRMLLENLTMVKSAELKQIKTIGIKGVERYLAKELQLQGEIRLNQIRDEAKKIAMDLGYQKEFNQLTRLISHFLSTNTDMVLESPYAKAIIKREPYDESRLQGFQNLSLYLQKCVFKERQYQYTKNSFKNISFFESYFSNFIEGTEFVIDEAEEIVFKGVEIHHRHEDSHDILASFYLANDYSDLHKIPKNALEFLNCLKARHHFLMKERPEKNPGEFKYKPNKAGNTYFVAPEEVIGTLTQGFEIYQFLKEGLPKALFMHFLVSEVHPFMDGNGRLARIMMNAELVSAGHYKIIVPTVCRDNYLGGLRHATRDQFFYTYCKVMDQLQAYTESVHWNDYGEAREKIEVDNANKTPDEGLPFFNRVLRRLDFSDLEHS